MVEVLTHEGISERLAEELRARALARFGAASEHVPGKFAVEAGSDAHRRVVSAALALLEGLHPAGAPRLADGPAVQDALRYVRAWLEDGTELQGLERARFALMKEVDAHEATVDQCCACCQQIKAREARSPSVPAYLRASRRLALRRLVLQRVEAARALLSLTRAPCLLHANALVNQLAHAAAAAEMALLHLEAPTIAGVLAHGEVMAACRARHVTELAEAAWHTRLSGIDAAEVHVATAAVSHFTSSAAAFIDWVVGDAPTTRAHVAMA
ncbi:MAG: hypothetical protein HS104_06315 [Polyangiaceae bacterium]|nr:hypothetical protein [Polyangiaceae bacterium]MCE7890103.1 hypothetical protein [Sorangiineae bacterium PRO1]MCL4756609.1 hypothetical protein [Myxococcales bacterium]